jgi:CcmD family protein
MTWNDVEQRGMTMGIRPWLVMLWSIFLLAAPALAAQPPAGQSEFVPVDQLPPADQLPAAPLLIAAYAFVWAAVMVYLWTIWRRLGKVEAEMRALERRQTARSGAR